MRVAIVQLVDRVGDLEGNAERIADAMAWAETRQVDVCVFPELALTGYPVSDLPLHEEFVDDAEAALAELAATSADVVSVVGTVSRVPPQQTWDSAVRRVSISSVLLAGGEERGRYHKVLLPTQGGYDEGRVFAPGREPGALWRIGEAVVGVSICEDLWSGDGPPEAQAAGGARIILAPNASPYWRGKADGRRRVVERVAHRTGVPLVYVNLVGGQDELVFDGGSLVADARGTIIHRSPEFVEDRAVLDVPLGPERPVTGPVRTVHTRPASRGGDPAPDPVVAPIHDTVPGVWAALVLGTHDFVTRNGSGRVVVGLSGGIDAAITAAVAVSAVGSDRVLGLSLPDADTPDEERAIAQRTASNLGIELRTVPIDDTVAAMRAAGAGDGHEVPARARTAVLRAVGAAEGRMVLATANKTELSIGEGAGHVEAAGHFAPLRDCPKLLLYELARHPDAAGGAVPEPVLDRPTSAQRRDGSFLDYAELDAIVERYVERGEGIGELVARGFDASTVVEVVQRIHDAELTRRLAPPGVKVTARAFTHDRKVPVSNGWRVHQRSEPSQLPAPAPDVG